MTDSARTLPMAGLTHGNRSPVTCHLRCGDACAKPAPNTTETSYFADIASRSLNRRTLLGAAAALALVPTVTSTRPASAAAPASGSGILSFIPIAPVPADVDTVTVPAGYRWEPILRWGDPLFPGATQFDPNTQTAESQASQFGYNCDYLNVIATCNNRAILVANHEYTNENIMFPPGTDAATQALVAIQAHGLSVVELKRANRAGAVWKYHRARRLNRRITGSTPFTIDGPAAGSALLQTKDDPTGRRVLGTLNNCSGGTTPWGTVLSGEENIDQYFYCNGTTAEETRYTLGKQDGRGWRHVDPRFDATTADYAHEPNRFGWIIEVDPMDPTSTPVKHSAMGRFKHEGANVIVAADGRVVAYMGDDQRFEYVYKFVSKNRYDGSGSAAARRRNLTLLSEGDLFVARFTGDGFADGAADGTGEWLQLTRDGHSLVPGMSIEEVLVYTRIAADKLSPTKMDRPEDVEPSRLSRKIYVACTNNTQRTDAQVDEANPRPNNKDGHIVEIVEDGNDNTATTFSWNLLLICGDPATAGTYFGGYTGPVSPISCPDNVAFDSEGNLWISTDGMPGTLKYDDGLYKVPLTGPERGRVQQFLAVPAGAETCGPVIHDRDGSVFVAVQHPGENGSWEQPTSYFPDYVTKKKAGRGDFKGPRPSIVQVVKAS